ncbi:MAG: hypothetical protein LQ349_006804, partial [Xanthoria aureola]
MGLIELPNEITLQILGNLSKQRLKRMRLVCNHLAILGASLLMDVVYISPRSKDTEVFESIVQHPVFNGATKHVVYDSAQIIGYSLEDYYNALEEQFEGSEYKRLRITNAAVQEMMDVINPPFESCSSTPEGFRRFQDRPDWIEDFRQQNQIALAQETHVDSAWFAGVCKGLRKLGPIQSVTIRNTWDMIYDEDTRSDTSGYTSEIGDDTHPGSKEDDQDIEDIEDQWENCGSSDASTVDMMLTKTPGGLRCDGTRLVGSPLARCWPPTWLNPPTDQAILSHRKNACGLPCDEWYSIRQEFLLVTQLLKSAGKQPLLFGVPGNSDHSESLSQHALKSPDAEIVHDSPFLYLAGKLQVLHLSIAVLKEDASQPLVPSLPLLRAFLEKAKSLVMLTLMFAVETWRHRDLDGSENNATFTFVDLRSPTETLLAYCSCDCRISRLYFSNVQLVGGGHWENIIEGLRQIRQLDRCSLDPSLLYPNFQIYTSKLSCVSEEDFLNANSNYILHGGRHPNLKNHEVDGASLKYLESLNQELDKV